MGNSFYTLLMTDLAPNVRIAPQSSGDRLTKLLRAPEMDPILLAAANLYLEEKNVKEISQELNIREDRVAQILEKEEVQKYIQNSILTQGYLNPLKSLRIIEQVIQKLLEQAMLDPNGKMTDKDLLDWIKELRATRESLSPKKTTPTVAVQVNNNIDKLYQDLQ